MTPLLQVTANQIWTGLAALLVVALLIILLIRPFDRRTLGGESVWSKPMRFALSLCVHFATFATIAHALPESMRDGAWLRGTAIISAAAGLFEIGYITLQAARGRHSHFNTRTTFEGTMAILMGIGAILVLIPSIAIGYAAIVGPLPQWSWSVRAGVIAGLWGGGILTFTTGMAMGAAANRFVPRAPKPCRTMWLTGWSLDGGDMRPAHFLATHMMQGVPVIAFMASMILPDLGALIVLAVTSVGWVLATMSASSLGEIERKIRWLPVITGTLLICYFQNSAC